MNYLDLQNKIKILFVWILNKYIFQNILYIKIKNAFEDYKLINYFLDF